MRNTSQRGWGLRTQAEQPRRTGKKRCYGHKSGSQYVAVLFGLQLPLTNTTLSIKWEVNFSKELCHSSSLRRYVFACICICIMWLYSRCTTWTLIKRMEKKVDGINIRMQQAILNKSWKQQPTKQHLYGHQTPITKTIQVRRTGHCWRSGD